MEILISIVVVALAFAALGAWIASQKNRDGGEGFILGLLFGPIGVIVEAVLPTLSQPAPQPLEPAPQLTEEEKDRLESERRRTEAQEREKKLVAARELEEWRKARIEQMRREAEAGQVRYWQCGQAEKSPDLAISDLSRFLCPKRGGQAAGISS